MHPQERLGPPALPEATPDMVLVRLDEFEVMIRDTPVTERFLEAYRIVTTDDRG